MNKARRKAGGRGAVAACLGGALLLAGGCSRFPEKWHTAGRFAPTGDVLDGRWEGTWLSDRNGHTGRLRCVVSKQGENQYEAAFQAKYWRVLTFHYVAPLETRLTETNVLFSGQANLGWWAGGLYRYAGQADTDRWFCTYSNRYDYGTFQMRKQ